MTYYQFSHKRIHTKIPKLFVNQSFHIPFGATNWAFNFLKIDAFKLLPLPSPTLPISQSCIQMLYSSTIIEWIFVWSQMLQNLGKPHISFWHHRIGSFACKHHSNFFLAICAQKQTLCLFTPLYLKHTHSTGSNFPLHPGMVQIPHPQGTGLKHSHAHW